MSMRKYFFVATVNDQYQSWEYERTIFEENEDLAEAEFLRYIRADYGHKNVDIDNIRWKDNGPVRVYITSTRDSYNAEGRTITVGDLIKVLSEFDAASPVYTVDNGGMIPVYGSLTRFLVNEESSEDEDW